MKKTTAFLSILFVVFGLNYNAIGAVYPNKIIGEIFLEYPESMVFSPDGKYLYVWSNHRETLYKIRTSDFSIVDSMDYHYDFYSSILVNIFQNGSNIIFLSLYDIRLVSTLNLAVYTTIDLDIRNPTHAAISPDARYLYIALRDSFSFNLINIETEESDSVFIGKYSDNVMVNPNGKYVYFINWDTDEINVVTTSDNNLKKTIEIGPLKGIVASPTGDHLYVASLNNTSKLLEPYKLFIINTSNHNINREIPIDLPCGPIEISPNGQYVYLLTMSDKREYEISVINTSKNMIVDKFFQDTRNLSIAASPDGNTLCVLDYDKRKINVMGRDDTYTEPGTNTMSNEDKNNTLGGVGNSCFLSSMRFTGSDI